MGSVFQEFEEIVNNGIKNNMPRDARLIIVGEILYAVTRDELTNKEGWLLENMLGGREEWEKGLEYAIFGDPKHGHIAPPLTISDRPLVIAGKTFHSRLMTGTGKYRSIAEMQQSVNASRCEIVTVAVRRVQTNAPGHEGLAEALDWTKIWMLPNTAGCQTADEAIRVARLGREMAKLLGQEDNNFVKLEVIPDAKYLLPDPIGTLEAAEQLVKEGFAVLPYINADPLLAKRLEEVGCATVMPLGSPIGSGQGINNAANIQIIIDTVKVPVVVDAGIGTPSEAARAMEMGADALLINSAIANAQNSPAMAKAMSMAAEAGRMAYLAGRMPIKDYAIASSPQTGTVTSK
ncbi:thiazole synthase [Microcoleus sp. B5-D4]|uniref:thiazole synthase n=2 Tax=Microcoleus TaxID=44471 RepID=UPI002FD319F1